MFVGIAKALRKFWPQKEDNSIEGQYKKYITYGYPTNHTYKIANGKITPKFKLAKRYNKIRKLYPKTLSSLAEIGCSKGFFVLSASQYPHCTRTFGIDVNPFDIEVCGWAKENLKNTRSTFKLMQLHEWAERVDEFGGPYQTLLIVNTYQYLYFGSDTFPQCYLDHDAIFKHLRKVCSGRIVFNNRIKLEDCQNVKRLALNDQRAKDYTTEKLIAAASKYFTVTQHGTLGRYPLLTFDAK